MSQITLGNLVRELQESVTVLSDKISALERKIIEQNSLIEKQFKIINDQSCAPTRETSVSKTTEESAQTAAPRPIRQASLKAKKLTAAANAAKKLPTTTARKSLAPPSVESPVPIQQQKQRSPPATAAAATAIPISDAASKTAPSQAVADLQSPAEADLPPSFTLLTGTKKNRDDKEEEGWQKVVTKRRGQRRSIVVGNGNTDTELQTVERMRFIQAWSFKPDTTSEMVTRFLKKTKMSDEYYVEKREIKTNRHASFVIGMPESLFSDFQSPSVWPQGVKFTDWFPARPRVHARGVERTQ